MRSIKVLALCSFSIRRPDHPSTEIAGIEPGREWLAAYEGNWLSNRTLRTATTLPPIAVSPETCRSVLENDVHRTERTGAGDDQRSLMQDGNDR